MAPRWRADRCYPPPVTIELRCRVLEGALAKEGLWRIAGRRQNSRAARLTIDDVVQTLRWTTNGGFARVSLTKKWGHLPPPPSRIARSIPLVCCPPLSGPVTSAPAPLGSARGSATSLLHASYAEPRGARADERRARPGGRRPPSEQRGAPEDKRGRPATAHTIQRAQPPGMGPSCTSQLPRCRQQPAVRGQQRSGGGQRSPAAAAGAAAAAACGAAGAACLGGTRGAAGGCGAAVCGVVLAGRRAGGTLCLGWPCGCTGRQRGCVGQRAGMLRAGDGMHVCACM